MRIGILGGTFDPPHFGHILLAKEAMRQCKLDKIVLLPSANPPHKKSVSSPRHRLNMAKIAARENGFDLCDAEYGRAKPSYTFDTALEMKKIYPDDDLFFIIGGDSVLDFEKWYRWEELLGIANFIAGARTQEEAERVRLAAEEKNRKYGNKITVITFTPIEVSSTEIRNGNGLENVSEKVREYIDRNNLYKSE